MSKYLYNYHTHTYRCNHAFGEDEEYVIEALKYGLKDLGFSDHIFLPGIKQSNVRGEYSCLNGYINSINSLKEKYKNQINIYLGFEAEYFDEFVDYYKDLLNNKKIDYLILGQHCFYQNNEINFFSALKGNKSIEKYADELIKGMESGLFKYVCHPDLFMLFRPIWDEDAKKCAERIIDAAERLNMPLEINLCQARMYGKLNIGSEYSYIYPFIPFWHMVAKRNIKIVYGFDSHHPLHVSNPNDEIIDDIVNTTGVKVDLNYKIQ